EDALFYESIQLSGRSDDYTRLAGRAGAAMMAALAVGSASSGVLASINLTLREPHSERPAGHTPKSFRQILGQSITLMRARPTLLYPMIYLALVPIASFITETLFLQPQSLSLGVPLAGIGVLVMAVQLTNMVA